MRGVICSIAEAISDTKSDPFQIRGARGGDTRISFGPPGMTTNAAGHTLGFADLSCAMGEYLPMQKSLIRSSILKSSIPALAGLAACLVLLGNARAQTSSGSQSSSGNSSAPSTQASSPGKSTAGQGSSTATKSTTTAKKTTAAPLLLKTDKEKQSYAMGMNLGLGLHRADMTLDPALLARGLRDAQNGTKTALTEDEMRTAVQQFQSQVRQKMQASAQEQGASNRKAGQGFLEANKTKAGVVTLPDGLQYKILKEGDGPKPTASDTVKCNYIGTLIDGKEFDSSSKHGGPASFPVSGVIKGWTEALELMPVGSKWELYIPADLAYGDRGAGQDIGPGETLIFDIELLGIQKQGEQNK
jgi:FKBP-type peptidyl-prolyl cis-trans isomerase FklB